MFKVYADDLCIFDDTVVDERVKLVDPVLTMEDSAAGSFEFTIYPSNIGYGNKPNNTEQYIIPMATTIRVYRDDEEIWEGRPVSEETDFYGGRKIYCEGELAYLNDTCQPQAQYWGSMNGGLTIRSFLEAIIAAHNQKVDKAHQFKVNQVWVESETIGDYRYTSFEKTLETINKLVEDVGGHIRVVKINGERCLDFFSDFGQSGVSSQKVTFGENLLDFTKSYDLSTLCSVLLPLGAKTANAGGMVVGDEVPIAWFPKGSYIGSDGYIYGDDDQYLDYHCTYGIAVKPGETYYITARSNNGMVMYRIAEEIDKENYRTLVTKTASSGIDVTDLIEEKVEIPEGGKWLWVCSLADTMFKTRVNYSKEIPDNLDEYVTVEAVNKNSLYVINSALLTKYGWIEKQIQWDDVTDPQILLDRAKDYLKDGQFEEMELEVSALDLKVLGVNVGSLNVLDLIQVTSPPHGLNKLFPITGLEIPLNDPTGMTFSLGLKRTQNLTEVNNDLNEHLLAKISKVPDPSKILESAKENAAALLANATGGHISITKNEDGNSTAEFLVSNTLDPTMATSIWIWNQNGLGHSDHYPIQSGENINLALTADGSIVADRITTGTLRSIEITGCKITVTDDSAYFLMMDSGKFYGGYGGNTHSWIDATCLYEDNGNLYRGFTVYSPAFAVYADMFMTAKTSQYGAPYGGGTGKVTVFTDRSCEYVIDLEFVNGIMVSDLSSL